MRDRERLEGRLVDGADLFGLVDEGLEIKFSKVSQGGSLLSNHSLPGRSRLPHPDHTSRPSMNYNDSRRLSIPR
jgi:hypothetical protein